MGTSRGRVLAAAATGVAAVVFGAGLGELAAGIVAPASSPFAVIGGALIDFAPPWAKETAIGLFGTNDKLALLVGIAIVLLVVAAAAGVVQLWRPPWGAVMALALGGVGALAAVTRANASSLAWVPAAVAGIAAALALRGLIRLLGFAFVAVVIAPPRRDAVPAGSHPLPLAPPDPESAPGVAESAPGDAESAPGVAESAPGDAESAPGDAESAPGGPRNPDRRRFFGWVGAAAAGGILAAIAGNVIRSAYRAVTAAREAIKLPTPATRAVTVPTDAELGIPGLSPVVTSNADFYRIDTALIVPQVDPASWQLRIHGLVDREVTLAWDQLLALPLEESVTTLTCVSNEVGGDLIGNAVWLGYPIRELLAQAGPHADADMVLSKSVDGFTASTPLEALTDDRNAILAVGMNGEPLPAEHGFPVRMVVPGLYGYVSATKWVVDLEVTRFADATGYWTTRGWSDHGPVKLESRIDVPRGGSSVAAGGAVIAGVAWQQHVGVSGVEVQVDAGAWQPATLARAISDDTWVQWMLPWAAASGSHTIRCRAISATDETQTADTAPPAPNGASGWHQVEVTVS